MATFVGYNFANAIYTSSPGLPDFESKDIVPSFSFHLASVIERGSLTSTQPVNENPATHTGYSLEQYGFLHFYNHIHFQYPILNLGNVLGDQNVQFWVFNAFFTENTLEDVSFTGDDLNINPGDADTPIVFAPFEQKYFDLSIPASGPPSVDSVYTFDFGFGTFDLQVFGNRLVLFPFIPQSDVSETLEFSTSIKPSDDESEQRTKRRRPRQRITYNVLLNDKEAAYMQSLIFDWQHRIFGVPIWFEARFNDVAALAGDEEIVVLSDSADFRVGGLLFIYESSDKYEAQAITAINADSIEIQAPLANSYSRALVMPIRDCYVANDVARDRFPINATDGTASFVSLTNADLSDISGWPTYAGRIYLNDLNIMSGRKAFNMNRTVRIVDTKTGTIAQSSKTDRSRVRSSKEWYCKNRAQVWKVRKLLHYLTGQKAFYIPTNTFDFELIEDIAPGGTTLQVTNSYYTTFIRNRRPFGDLRVILNNGTEYVRQIIDSNSESGNEVLTINSFLSVSAIAVEDVARIELVMLMRVSDDKAQLTHSAGGKATIVINTVSTKA